MKEVKDVHSFRTVDQEVTAEIKIKKSRFIAAVCPVENEEEARSFINTVSKAHRDATHNVYAYRLPNAEKFSDDGEPSGTAGKPVLNVLKGAELYNVAVVVTRYFGGVLLGAGGLVRAYSQSAALGVEQARIITKELCQLLQVEFPLPLFGLVKNSMENFSGKTLQANITERAVLTIRLSINDVEAFQQHLTEISAGQARLIPLAQEYVDTKNRELSPLSEIN